MEETITLAVEKGDAGVLLEIAVTCAARMVAAARNGEYDEAGSPDCRHSERQRLMDAKAASAIYDVLRHLGQISRISFSRNVRTARIIRRRARFTIEFNPDFVKEYIHYPADVLHLVSHELLHKVRGDLFTLATDTPQKKWLRNLAADILVDAHLERLFFREAPPYLMRLYDRMEFPENLLLPPKALLDASAEDATPRGGMRSVPRGRRGIGRRFKEMTIEHARYEELVKICKEHFARCLSPMRSGGKKVNEKRLSRFFEFDTERLAEAYVQAWRRRPTLEALVADLSRFFKDDSHRYARVIVFLGDHEYGEESGEPVDLPDWLVRPLREWMKGGKRAAYSEHEEEERIEVEKRACWKFYEAVRLALEPDPNHHILKEMLTTDRGVIVFPGRREALMLGAGYFPAFYPYTSKGIIEDEWRVHLYVDVSGSTHESWSILLGLVSHLGEIVGEPVYQFSNRVEEVSLTDLSAGAVRTSRGTDFDCVAEHILRNRFRRALIVTDGHAELHADLAARLKSERVMIFVVLTEDNPACPLLPMATKWWEIPPEVTEAAKREPFGRLPSENQ